MHSNAIQKAAEVAAAPAEAVSAEELRLINTYTRRNLSAEEVYVFSVTLCDNDVDRDNERFTVESLFALEKLFVGKNFFSIKGSYLLDKTCVVRWFLCFIIFYKTGKRKQKRSR